MQRSLFQTPVLFPGFTKNRQIGVGVFPQGVELFVGLAASIHITCLSNRSNHFARRFARERLSSGYISNNTTPRLQVLLRASVRSPCACSGDYTPPFPSQGIGGCAKIHNSRSPMARRHPAWPIRQADLQVRNAAKCHPHIFDERRTFKPPCHVSPSW